MKKKYFFMYAMMASVIAIIAAAMTFGCKEEDKAAPNPLNGLCFQTADGANAISFSSRTFIYYQSGTELYDDGEYAIDADGKVTATVDGGDIDVTATYTAATSSSGKSKLSVKVGSAAKVTYTEIDCDDIGSGGNNNGSGDEDGDGSGNGGGGGSGTNAPSAPTGVTAVVSGTSVVVSWTAVSAATQCTVYHSTSASSGYSVAGTSTTNSYTHTSPATGANYYKVAAANSAGTSSQSASASVNFTGSSGGGDGGGGSGTTAPSAPTGVSASLSGTSVSITWTAVSGATSYKVVRSSSSSGTYAQIGAPTTAYYTDASPLTGANYYKVKAVNSAGESANSSSYGNVNYTGSGGGDGGGSGTSVPAKVTGVTAAVSGTSIVISWSSVTGATSYKLYASIAGSSVRPSSAWKSGLTSTSYTDTDPNSGANYYWVSAVNSAGEGAVSNSASATYSGGGSGGGGTGGSCTPAAPTGVTATSLRPNGIKISWTAVSCSDLINYQISRSTSASGTYTGIGTVWKSDNLTTYTDNATGFLNPNTSYYYKVEAVGSSGSNTSTYASCVY